MANYCHVFPSATNFSLPYKILPLCSYILKSSLSKCWELYFYLIFIRQRLDKFWNFVMWSLEFARLRVLWDSGAQNRSRHVLWQELRRLENRWQSVN